MDKLAYDIATFEKLKTKLNSHFKKATSADVRDAQKSEEKLVEIKKLQSSLIEKNMKGIIRDELLKEQLDILEKETMEIQSSLVNYRKTELNVDELIEWSKDFLLNPSKAWRNSDLETRTKLQWLEFPEGVVYDGQKFLTAKVACIFKAKEAFQPLMSTRVDPTGLEPATPSLQMRCSTR